MITGYLFWDTFTYIIRGRDYSIKMIKLKKLKRKTANSNRTRFKIRTVPNSVIVVESGLHVVLSDDSLGLTKSRFGVIFHNWTILLRERVADCTRHILNLKYLKFFPGHLLFNNVFIQVFLFFYAMTTSLYTEGIDW